MSSLASAEASTATEPAAIEPRRRRGSIAQLASASYLTIALALVTSPLVARALGPTVRGEYAAIFVYSTMLTTVLAFGLPSAVMHRLVNRVEAPQRLMGTTLRFAAVLTVPATLLSLAIVLGVLDTLSGVDVYLAIAAIALAPAGVLGTCFQSFMTAEGALRPMAILRALPLLLNFLAVVTLFAAGQLTLTSYLIATIAISIVSGLASWHYVRVRPRGHTPFRPLLRFGLRAYPGSFAKMLNVQLDQILLVPLVAPAQLAFYAIAVTISRVPISLAEAIAARAAGSIVADRVFIPHRAERYLRLTLLVSSAGCLGLAFLSPFAVPLLYGHAFDGVVGPLLFLLPGTIANAGSRVAANALVVRGRPGVTSTAELGSLAITGIGLWFALPRYGIEGAAAVSSLAYAFRLATQLYVLHGLGVRRLMPRPADVVTVYAAGRRLLRQAPSGSKDFEGKSP